MHSNGVLQRATPRRVFGNKLAFLQRTFNVPYNSSLQAQLSPDLLNDAEILFHNLSYENLNAVLKCLLTVAGDFYQVKSLCVSYF